MSAQDQIASQILSAKPPAKPPATLSTQQSSQETKMPEQTTAIAKTTAPSNGELATSQLSEEMQLFLARTESENLDFGREHVKTARTSFPILRAVQRTTQDEEVFGWGLGSLYITIGEGDSKQHIFLGKKGARIIFNPLFLYTSYNGWREWKKEQANQYPFHEISTDPDSMAARRATSFNDSIRNIPNLDKPEEFISYREHLNVIALLNLNWCEEWETTPVAFSFSKGSAKDGKAFNGLAFSRQFPYYLCCFELSTVLREYPAGDTQSFTVNNPEDIKNSVVKTRVQERTDLYNRFAEEKVNGRFDESPSSGEEEDTAENDRIDANVIDASY